MSWKEEIVPLIRGLVNDLDSSDYTDDTLEEIAVLSASFVNGEVDFPTAYTITIPSLTISPDPTVSSPKDYDFMNLIALKSACILLLGEAKTAAATTIKIVDGPSAIDTKGQYEAKQKSYENMCDKYNMYKLRYQAGGSRAGQAVLGPYTDTSTGNNKRFY